MRRLEPKPKDRRKVPIPDDLREALTELHELIRQAKHDPDIELGFDDAVQLPRLCGGGFGKKLRPFVLTYFPEGDGDRGRWFLTLHPTEIEDIADGCQTELLLYCCVGPDCRGKFRELNDYCFHCDYQDG